MSTSQEDILAMLAQRQRASTQSSPDFQQTVADINTPTYERQGIVDTSTAEAIEFLGGQALAAHKGYQEAGLETDLQNEISSFFQGVSAESRIPGQAENVSLLSEQTADLLSPEEDEALKSARKDLARLGKLRARGATTSLELKARLEAITQQYVNKVPGLAEDFRALARAELGDVKSRLALVDEAQSQAAAAAKAKADEWKVTVNRADELGLDPLTRPKEQWYPEYVRYQANKRMFNELKQLAKTPELRNIAYLDSPEFAQAQQGGLLTLRAQLDSIMARTDIDPVAQQQAITAAVTQFNSDVVNTFNKGATIHPKVAAFQDQINTVGDQYIKVASGDLSAEAARNNLNFLSDTLSTELITSDPRIARLITLSKHFKQDNILNLESGDVARNAPLEIFSNVLNRGYTFTTPAKRTAAEQAKVTPFFKSLTKWTRAIVNDKEDSPVDVNLVLETINTTLDNWSINETPPAFDGLLELTSQPEFYQFMEKHGNPELRSKLSNVVEGYITDRVSSAFTGRFNPDTMRLVTTESGDLYVQATDPAVQADVNKINKSYTNRFNMYIKTSAHLQGTSNYKSATDRIAAALNTEVEANKVVQEKGTDITNYDKKDVEKLVTAYPWPTGTEVYIPTPLDLLQGENVDEYQVLIDHLVNVVKTFSPKNVGEQSGKAIDIVEELWKKMPHNRPWAIKAREEMRKAQEGGVEQQGKEKE